MKLCSLDGAQAVNSEMFKLDTNDTVNNFANSCSLENIRRVKINMSSDSNNTDTRLYELTISSIPTYHYE